MMSELLVKAIRVRVRYPPKPHRAATGSFIDEAVVSLRCWRPAFGDQ